MDVILEAVGLGFDKALSLTRLQIEDHPLAVKIGQAPPLLDNEDLRTLSFALNSYAHYRMRDLNLCAEFVEHDGVTTEQAERVLERIQNHMIPALGFDNIATPEQLEEMRRNQSSQA